MPIRELFHLMHMVDDFDAADAFFSELFAPEVIMPKSWGDFDKRWATIGLVGRDFSLELMEASRQEEDRDHPLPKFAQRFGQHLHSFAWYVDAGDLAPLVSRLRDHGIRVVRPDGSRFGDGPITDVPDTVFTHGRDTCGQVEFQRLGTSVHDPRFDPGWSDAFWREEQPLGIQRLSHVTVLVADHARARGVFVDAFGGRLVHEHGDGEESRSYVLVGTDTMVELLEPGRADSRWGRELAVNGELPNAITFLVRDLDAAERHVEKVGASISSREGDSFTADPGDTFGAVLTFTTRRIPGDPRDR
jgi:catechol 2,3-dioxygenase-like lactoylglutathione lyase family enzyme